MKTNASIFILILLYCTTEAVHPTPRPPKLEASEIQTEWCPSWKNLICGSDGKNYWNECLFKHAQNHTADLTMIQAGVCEEPECLECKHSSNLNLYSVCSSNNKKLADYCSLKCYAEDYPLINEDYNGCNSPYPPAEEVENAYAEYFLRMMEELIQRTMGTLDQGDNTPKLELGNFQGVLSSKNMTFKTVGRQGWTKKISNITVMDGFSFSADNPGRLRFELETDNVTIGYDKVMVFSGPLRASTSVTLNIRSVSLELIGDVRAVGAECTRFFPISLAILQMHHIKMETSVPLPAQFPSFQLEGFIKERFFTNLNMEWITLIIPEIFRTGCLSWGHVGASKCFGAFQTRFCSYEDRQQGNDETVPDAGTPKNPAGGQPPVQIPTSTTESANPIDVATAPTGAAADSM